MITSRTIDSEPHPRQQLYRYALRMGLLTAALMILFELGVHFILSDNIESLHLLKYLILFVVIGYGSSHARPWIRPDHASNDSMVFGLSTAACTALGLILYDILVSVFNYHLDISDTIVPIDDPFKFAVNAMATLWGCLIFGFLTSFIFTNAYKRM